MVTRLLNVIYPERARIDSLRYEHSNLLLLKVENVCGHHIMSVSAAENVRQIKDDIRQVLLESSGYFRVLGQTM